MNGHAPAPGLLVVVLGAGLLAGCQVGIQEPWILSDQELREERARTEALEHRLRHRAVHYYGDR